MRLASSLAALLCLCLLPRPAAPQVAPANMRSGVDSLLIPVFTAPVSTSKVFFTVPSGQQFVLTQLFLVPGLLTEVSSFQWDLFDNATWRWPVFPLNGGTGGASVNGPTTTNWTPGLEFDAGHAVSLRMILPTGGGGPVTGRFAWVGYLVPQGTTAVPNATNEQRLGFRLAPNPVRQVLSLRFELARKTDVELAIFDTQGRRVRKLMSGPLTAGVHEVAWDGRTSRENMAAPGTYYARIASSEANGVQKFVRLN